MKRWLTSSLVFMVLLLAGAELIARVFFAQDISGRFEYGFHPRAGFAEQEDGTVKLFRAGGRRFLPQTFQRRRPPGTFRIFVIGDSVPRGPSFKAAYAYVLGEELKRRQIPAESFNLAVAGYGARRCQIVMRKVLDYEPSLIILHVNNSNEFEDEREYRRSQEFKSWHPSNWLLKPFIFRRLYEAKTEKAFWRLVPKEIRLRYAENDADAQIAASHDPEKVRRWQQVNTESTAASVALARQHQVPILLVAQGRLEPGPGKTPSLDDHGLDDLVRSLSGPGVYYLSMKDVFTGRPDLRALFADTGHLRASGHQLLARALRHKIEQEYLGLGLADLKKAAAGGGG